MKPMNRAFASLAALGVMATVGCNNHPTVPVDQVFEVVRHEGLSAQGSNKIDILFVIANSTSVDEERVLLEEAFPSFIRGLLDLNADFHVGVITPDMKTANEQGVLHGVPFASAAPGYDEVLVGDDPVSCTTDADCPEGECAEGGTCVVPRVFCDDTPANLDYCFERFHPLYGLDNQPVSCTTDADCLAGREDVLSANYRCNATQECEVRPNFLRREDYLRGSNVDVDPDEVVGDFNCLSAVGTCSVVASTAPERAFDAVRRALDVGNPINPGFIRADALLLLVFVSDDDDCSIGDGTERLSGEDCWGARAADLLRENELYSYLTSTVKSTPNHVMTAAIVGPVPRQFEWNGYRVSCTAADDSTGSRVAYPGDRYTRFIRLFGNRGVVGSICEANFDPVLSQVTRAVSRSLGQNCLSTPPYLCTEDADCSGDATCVIAAAPRVLMRDDETGEAYACTTSSDCVFDGASPETRICDAGTCYQADLPAGTSPRRVCSDFQVAIEVGSEATGIRRLVSPGAPDSLDYADDRDYEVNYYAQEACPTTGIGFRFINSPTSDARVNVVYPISVRDQIFR